VGGTPARAVRFEVTVGYPDWRYHLLEGGTLNYTRIFNSPVQQLATDMLWCEGPVWFGDGRYLLWSDIGSNAIMRWDEVTRGTSIFRQPSNNSNGNTRDRQGRLITCEHLSRQVTRTEYDGSITVLASHYNGVTLNSPNDVVVKSDGSIWFTDPPFGRNNYFEGRPEPAELGRHVYRIDPQSGEVQLVADDARPNGLCFSPDESILYVTDAGGISMYDVVDDGTRLANKRFFTQSTDGGADGIKCDMNGNVWAGWSGSQSGVRAFDPSGVPGVWIELPERAANICFGGIHRNRLFMAASQSVYAVHVNVQGVPYA
jgi:gluconolactonase